MRKFTIALVTIFIIAGVIRAENKAKEIINKQNIEQKFDRLYFRNGEVWSGEIVRVNEQSYIFKKYDMKSNNQKSISIPKTAIKYALYSDFNKQKEFLGIEESLKFYEKKLLKKSGIQKDEGNNEKAKLAEKITFLPTIQYGEQVVKELNKAKENIYILTYLISGTNGEPIKSILNILEEKIKQGVDVRLIMSQDAGTRQPIRVTNLREGKALVKRGFKIKFSEGAKVMHKKIWIIDQKILIVGSSNLTQSSFRYGNNSNVLIEDKNTVQRAIKDFQNLWENCKFIE